MEDFHARKTPIDGCAALKGRTVRWEIERPRGTVNGFSFSLSLSRRQVQVTTGYEKVDCARVRIMKEIPNGVENTGNSRPPGGALFHFSHTPFSSALSLPARQSPIVIGLGSFAAAVGSTR